MLSRILFLASLAMAVPVSVTHAADADLRTPPSGPAPRLTGPTVFGVRPGAPFLFTITATGERPMAFAADGLPAGLQLDRSSGRITGRLTQAGEFPVTLRASNARGRAERILRIVCGERIALTPPLGWNSWNSWAAAVDQDKVMRSARALVASGLANHGWTYVNIDDTWQGERGGAHGGILTNEKFPDMKKLCDDIHALGLKAGIYSTPWVTSYAGFRGGTADTADGAWSKVEGYNEYKRNHRLASHSFAKQDAAQWADWGFDYLKFDWNPNDVAHTREMAEALRATGRDIVFSLSNSAPFADIAELAKYANAWRTTGDIVDAWQPPTPEPWQHSVTEIGFNQDRWVPYGGPGHWNDPDMLVVGWVGWGPQLHPTKLTAAEQYSHISLWALLSAPMLIGCDLDRLDELTLNLLSNDEVIDINQDALGTPARRVATLGAMDVYRKPLEDGSVALGFFNRGDQPHSASILLERFELPARSQLRDVWHQRNLGDIEKSFDVTVAPHDVVLYRISAAK